MKTHNQRMDVIGNNISNVNTTGYKTSEVTFKDVYYQTKANASSGDATSGGKNPTQIGYGAQLGTVSQVMVQSGFTYTDSKFNCALQGEGFFQVMDDTGNIYYTRAGKFSVDSYGNLCDPNGNMVLGVSGDPTGIETGQSQRINLHVPPIEDNRASVTKTVNGYDVTITASEPGEQGNISFTIVNSDTPFATKTGDSLVVYMDLDQDFGNEALADYCRYVLDTANGLPASVTGSQKYTDFTSDTTTLQAKYGTNYTTNDQYWIDLYYAVEEEIETAMEDTTNNATFINNVANQRNVYTQAALQDFEDKLNQAITQGGVGLDEGVLDLDIDFTGSNTLNLSYVDANGNDQNAAITFTADTPGEFGNKFEIDLKYSSSVGAEPSAKWKDSVLTITLPASASLEDIQTAIDKAATDKGDDSYRLTVSLTSLSQTDNTTTPPTVTDMNDLVDTGGNYYFDFSTAIGSKTQRLGLDNGRDNFFSDLATSLSTVTLTDGRLAKEQAVDDLEVIQIDSDGTIYGRHAVHGLLLLGRIDIATFENPTGLEQCGTSLWRASLASGEAQVKIGGKDGAGEVIQGALEMSNVDLAQEFSDMIITQRGYQANSRIITVSDTMLEELVNLKR